MAREQGTYRFDISAAGALVDNDANLRKLRELFRDSDIIDGNWGPGNDGDFDNGSWHILCHLAAGAGIFKTPAGPACVGITHSTANDTYEATVSARDEGSVRTVPVPSTQGVTILNDARCLGFLEGSSQGHISARNVRDAAGAFNGWPRQDYDRDVHDSSDGGTVWEHWSTTRDIRPSSAIGTSVLRAYLTLVSTLGGRFVSAVARGRREHGHPGHLVALVTAGVLTRDEATWDVTPEPISPAAQDLLYEARPEDTLAAVEMMPFDGSQRYFMYQRRIGKWSKTPQVKRDLGIYLR